MATRYEYLKARNLEEASELLKQHGDDAKIIAGGTDVIVAIKQKKICPKLLVSIRNLKDLSYIKKENDVIKIGALTTHRQLEHSRVVAEKIPALMDAVKQLGSVQIRNVATIGGNICNAAPSADTVPPLLVHNALLRIYSTGRERVVPLRVFFKGPGKHILEHGEILVEICVPLSPETASSAYWKHSRRQAIDLAVVGVALYLDVDIFDAQPLILSKNSSWEAQYEALDQSYIVCKEVRISLGVAAPTPIRVESAEEFLRGRRLTREVLLEFGRIAALHAQVRDTFRGEAWYRREMIRILPARLVLTCLYRILGAEGGPR